MGEYRSVVTLVVTVLAPRQARADDRVVLVRGEFGLELLDDLLVLEVPDLDGVSNSGAESVPENAIRVNVEYRKRIAKPRSVSYYLLGEKVRAFMTSFPGRVYRCLPSFTSQSMAWKSFGLMIKQMNKRETKLNTHTAVLSSESTQRDQERRLRS